MNNLDCEENQSSNEQLDPFQQLLIRYIHRVGECFPLENELQREVKKLAELIRNNNREV